MGLLGVDICLARRTQVGSNPTFSTNFEINMIRSIDDVLKDVVLQFMFEPCDVVTEHAMLRLIGNDLEAYVREHLKLDFTDTMNIRISCGDLFDRVVAIQNTEE